MNKKITIGRSRYSDICIDERWDTVSNEHADITQEGTSLFFYDHSSNGTVINKQKVQNISVEINRGDEILLAGVYKLDWNVLDRFFPGLHRPTVTRISRNAEESFGRKTVKAEDNFHTGSSWNGGRKTEQYGYASGREQRTGHSVPDWKNENYGQANAYSQAEIDKEIEKWNWGAFFCSWVWAVYHRIYWPLIILIVGCIPYLGQIAGLCLSVYLGFEGSKLAWGSGRYKDFERFKNVQHKWVIGGVIWFILSLVSTAYVLSYTLSL